MKSDNISYSSVLQAIKHPDALPVDIFNRIHTQAKLIGPCTEEVSTRLWISSISGVYSRISSLFHMADYTSEEKLEAACTRALFYGFYSMRIIKIIMEERLYQLPLSDKTDIYGQRMLFEFL